MNDLAHLSDDVLLTSVKRLTGTTNELTARLLAHLGEVEARGIHRNAACATLYTYCVYELRMSEDEAQRRCRAARLCRQFPLLLAMLADASIHLTGILLLGPHLTDDNQREVLGGGERGGGHCDWLSALEDRSLVWQRATASLSRVQGKADPSCVPHASHGHVRGARSWFLQRPTRRTFSVPSARRGQHNGDSW